MTGVPAVTTDAGARLNQVALATRVVRHEVRIEARPDTVFAFFTDPSKMVLWIGTEATLDPRPGGVCRIDMSGEDGAAAICGEFVEVVPHDRVVLTWGWEDNLFRVPPASTRLEFSLLADGDATIVGLVHRRVPHVAADLHLAGWMYYCARLACAAAGGSPGADAWLVPATVGAALRDGVLYAHSQHLQACSTGWSQGVAPVDLRTYLR